MDQNKINELRRLCKNYFCPLGNDIRAQNTALLKDNEVLQADLKLNAGMLAKHVNDAAWAQLISFTGYKAERAGGETKKVNPRGTSQECPGCGQIRKKQLSERIHRCDCGCVGDRDTVSSVVIHYRAFGHVQGTCIKTLTERIAA